jgi:hypothetical protein
MLPRVVRRGRERIAEAGERKTHAKGAPLLYRREAPPFGVCAYARELTAIGYDTMVWRS